MTLILPLLAVTLPLMTLTVSLVTVYKKVKN